MNQSAVQASSFVGFKPASTMRIGQSASSRADAFARLHASATHVRLIRGLRCPRVPDQITSVSLGSECTVEGASHSTPKIPYTSRGGSFIGYEVGDMLPILAWQPVLPCQRDLLRL